MRLYTCVMNAIPNNGVAKFTMGTDTNAAYPGHPNISNTVHYAEVAPNRFRRLWKD